MKLLHRYIFSSIAGAGLFGAGTFAFVLVTANAMKDVMDRLASGQLGILLAAKMIGLLIPFTLSYAAPMGLLVGILLILGRMSARNEIVAMKSAGVSLWRISAPVLLIAVLGSTMCAFVNNYYAPVARTQYREMLSGVVQHEPLSFIVPGRFVRDFPGYVIYVGERKGENLGNIWLWVLGPDKELRQFIQAREGTIRYDKEDNDLVLSVDHATGQFRPSAGDLSQVAIEGELGHTSFAMSLANLLPSSSGVVKKPTKLSNMSLGQLLEVRNESAKDMANISSNRLLGNSSSSEDAPYTKAEILHTRASYYISRNFAFAYSVIALAMLGIPLGIRVGRQETYANMAVALGLSLLYFLLVFMAGWAERSPGAYPQLLVWLPNLFFQGLGLLMMRRSNQH